MYGTLINAGAVIVGSSIGLLLNKKFPDKYSQIFFQCTGIFTLVLGLQMALVMASPLLVVLSLIVGGLTGEFLKIEERMKGVGDWLKRKLKVGNDRFTEGFITAFLLFCMGTMSILGPMEEGLTGSMANLLKIKSITDGFSALFLATIMGVGVLFSFIPLTIYQGGITLISMVVGDNISEIYINAISVVGGLLLIGLAIDILQIKKISIMNMLPALVYVCLFVWISGLF